MMQAQKYDHPLHWLYIDYQHKRANLSYLRGARDAARNNDPNASIHWLKGYAAEEQTRLSIKVGHMKPGESYPYTLLGDDIEDLQATAQSLLSELQAANPVYRNK